MNISLKLSHRIFALMLALMCFVAFTVVPAFAAENEEYTVSGRWEFNETLIFDGFSEYEQYAPYIAAVDGSPTQHNRIKFTEDELLVFTTKGIQIRTVYRDGAWCDARYTRIVDFGETPQVVSEIFYKFMETNAVWLDAPPPPPDPFVEMLDDVGLIFGSTISWVKTVCTTIVNNPLLLLFSIVGLVGLGVGMFKRLINVKG